MNQNTVQPGLLGLAKSNRDFSQANSWGKNQFNNCLACYMHSQGLQLVYLTLDTW